MKKELLIILLILALTAAAENSTPPKLCTDTDGGGSSSKDDSIKVLGSVKYGITPMSDTCLTSEEGVRTNSSKWLREYYCENDQRKEKVHDCIKYGFEGCVNGACKGTSSSTSQQTQTPVSSCGNERLEKDKGEQCDPPGKICFGKSSKEYGLCLSDCTCKVSASVEREPAVCGDDTRDQGEECEKDDECPSGFLCSSCKCVKQLTPAEIEAMKKSAKPNKTAQQEVDEKYPESEKKTEVDLTPTNFSESPAIKATSAISTFFKSIFSWLGNLFG